VTIRGFSKILLLRLDAIKKPSSGPESQLAMASSMRLPVGTIFPSARPISLIAQSFASGSQYQQCRSFSAAAQRWAYRSQNFKPSSPAQPSMKSRAKDVMMHQLPNDIGLLPGTFVRPMWKDMPSIFQEPRDRLRMEWTWMKSVFQGYAR
jgi:protein MBA1